MYFSCLYPTSSLHWKKKKNYVVSSSTSVLSFVKNTNSNYLFIFQFKTNTMFGFSRTERVLSRISPGFFFFLCKILLVSLKNKIHTQQRRLRISPAPQLSYRCGRVTTSARRPASPRFPQQYHDKHTRL